MNLEGLRKLLQKAERDARLLDGRDFKLRPWSEAYRLIDLLKDAAALNESQEEG